MYVTLKYSVLFLNLDNIFLHKGQVWVNKFELEIDTTSQNGIGAPSPTC